MFPGAGQLLAAGKRRRNSARKIKVEPLLSLATRLRIQHSIDQEFDNFSDLFDLFALNPPPDYGHSRPHTSDATMFKPTQALCRRYRKLPLTTKDVKKGFYKGTRTKRMGTHTKWGGYKIDYSLVRTYVVPDLKDFKVRGILT